MSTFEEIHDREVVQRRRTVIYALVLLAVILTILSAFLLSHA
jgi:hypothetical protein